MNKKLIALAVAGALTAPMAAAADSANVTIYGQMHYSWDFVDTNQAAGDSSDDATGVSRASRVGFKGDEDLGNGLKAVWQVETQIDGTLGNRNTFVGLAGNWGTLVAGRHDTPYKIATGSLDPFSDTVGDYNNIIGSLPTTVGGAANTLFDERAPQTVAYITPNFNGFTGAIARVSTKLDEGVADETQAWSMMGMYQNGPFFASLAYETYDDGLRALNGLGFGAPNTTGTDSNSDAWKLGLGYTFGNTKVGFVYENVSSSDFVPSPVDGVRGINATTTLDPSRDAWYLSLAHSFGNNTLKFAYGNAQNSDSTTCTEAAAAAANVAFTCATVDANNGADMWALGIDHDFSKRTKVYAMYAAINNDNGGRYGLNSGNDVAGQYRPAAGDDADAFSVGIVHKF